MWNNQKQQTSLVFLMSNLQTYYHLKLDFQKVDQYTRGRNMSYHISFYHGYFSTDRWMKKETTVLY